MGGGKPIPENYAAKIESARQTNEMQGERRVVTALFCDVTGSTAMAEKMDPEEWAQIMDDAFDYIIAPVYKYEGTVARLMGDAILAFFGAPIAHEDDPQRAILASLEIIDAVKPYNQMLASKAGLDFQVRVGINTGMVVVGEIGSDLKMEYTVMGDAVNLAARMEQTAIPGSVQISEDTYKLVGPLFEVEDLGGIEVKGKSDPVNAYRVLKKKDLPGRVRGIQGLDAPLIGRNEEFEKIKKILDGLGKGRGHILTLVGEAGLGKSRLIREIKEYWTNTEHGNRPFGALPTRWNMASGMSYETSQPYNMLQKMIRNFIGVKETDPPQMIRECLIGTFSFNESSAREKDLLEILLGVGRIKEGDPGGVELKNALHKLMLDKFAGSLKAGPLCLVFDDLHWSDPASIEFLLEMFSLTESYPVLFICAMRPERKSYGWRIKQVGEADFTHRYSEINLSPLSAKDSDLLVDNLLTISDLPAKLRKMILEKGDGNPFFVEEIIRTLIDDNLVALDADTGRWRVIADIGKITLPDNLQALLAARIDRLEEESRKVLQLASVIGRSFYHNVLELIVYRSTELEQRLNELQRVELILEVARDPDLEYMFRHALTQETAYNSILIKDRREFHLATAKALEKMFSGREEEFASILGHHYYQADDPRAVKYLEMAGEAAYNLYASPEAENYFRMAVEQEEKKNEPDTGKLTHLYLRLGRTLELQSKFSEAIKIYLQMEKFANKYGDKAMLLRALLAVGEARSIPSTEYNVEIGVKYVDMAEKLAEELGAKQQLARIYWIKTNLLRFQESTDIIKQYGDKAIELARELGLDEQLAYSLNDTSHTYSIFGEIIKARELTQEAAQIWRKLDNKPMLADSLSGTASIEVFSGNFDAALKLSQEARKISEEINNIWGMAYSQYSLGIMYRELGEYKTAFETNAVTLDLSRKSNFAAGEVFVTWFNAMAKYDLGMFDPQDFKYSFGESVGRGMGQAWDVGILMGDLFDSVINNDLEKSEQIITDIESMKAGLNFITRNFYEVVVFEFLLKTQNFSEAVSRASKNYKVQKENGMNIMLPETLYNLAKAYLGSGDAEKEYEILIEAAEQGEKIKSRRMLYMIYQRLSAIESEKGNDKKSEDYLKKAFESLDFVLENIPTEEMRKIFIAKDHVKNLLASRV